MTLCLDNNFSTDEPNLLLMPIQSFPVGSRGRVKLNIPPNLLTIPVVHKQESNAKVSGRGRRLQKNEEFDAPLKIPNASGESMADFCKKTNHKRLQDEKVWPSLSATHAKNSDSSSSHSPKKVIHRCSIEQDSLMKKSQGCKNEITTTGNSMNSPGNSIQSKIWRPETFECNVEEEQFSDCCENKTITSIQQIPLEEKTPICQIATKIFENIPCDEKPDDSSTLPTIPVNGIDVPPDENDYSSKTFLETLSDKDCYVLVENLPLKADGEVFQQLVATFGDVVVFLIQQASKSSSTKLVLIKMDSSSHCDWVISCLDGSIYEEGDERLVVQRIEDILVD